MTNLLAAVDMAKKYEKDWKSYVRVYIRAMIING